MAANASAIIDALARKGCLPPSRSNSFVNCGAVEDKVRFQALFHDGYVEVGLAFDDADAEANQRRANPYVEQLKDEIHWRDVEHREASNVYLLQRLETAGLPAEDAANAILGRLAWWRARFRERPPSSTPAS
jgi:hypothetical protein